MSTSLHAASFSPSWKQEVNRRVAAHLNRKLAAAGEAELHSESRPPADSRAAQAAARVAARYAKAPSYSEMLADEARVVMRAAQAASRAAQEAHAAAQSVLDGLEAVSAAETAAEPDWEPQALPAPLPQSLPHSGARRRGKSGSGPVAAQPSQTERRYFEEAPLFAHWEPLAEPAEVELRDPSHESEVQLAEWHGQEWHGNLTAGDLQSPDDPQTSAQPIHANLIEFPRPMVAARRVRPRLAEGPLAVAESAPQLSIFEVDPGTVSCEPSSPEPEEAAAPEWMLPRWPAMDTDAQAYEEFNEEAATEAPAARAIEPASMSRRLLAIVVDFALMVASFLGLALLIERNATHLPAPHAAELCAGIALLIIGSAYLAFFFTMARATPGMRYAGIQLSTFEGLRPSRAQRCGRLLALPLSVLPLGLGLAWALLDDGQLAWHDRLSQTYLRKRW